MPYPYGYFKPTGKEQGAMAIGSLLAGLLAAGQPRQQGEASPALKGIAGATAGYGSGYKAYQDMMQDAWQRDLYDKKHGLEERQYEETEKPESKAKMDMYNKFGFFGTPPGSIIEDQYSQGLTPERKQEFNRYAAPITVPMLAEMSAKGDKQAQAALAQVNVPQLFNSDQGVKLVNRRTDEIKDTGLTQKPEISDTAIEKFGSINTLQQSVNDLSLLADKVSMGPLAGRLEQAKGNWFNNLSSDEQLEFNTINQQIFNTLGELRSGKVLTENEMSRLLAELPNQNLPYKTYKVRLKMLNKYLDRTLENKLKTYEQGNYNVEGIKQQKTTVSPQTADDFINLLEGK